MSGNIATGSSSERGGHFKGQQESADSLIEVDAFTGTNSDTITDAGIRRLDPQATAGLEADHGAVLYNMTTEGRLEDGAKEIDQPEDKVKVTVKNQADIKDCFEKRNNDELSNAHAFAVAQIDSMRRENDLLRKTIESNEELVRSVTIREGLLSMLPPSDEEAKNLEVITQERDELKEQMEALNSQIDQYQIMIDSEKEQQLEAKKELRKAETRLGEAESRVVIAEEEFQDSQTRSLQLKNEVTTLRHAIDLEKKIRAEVEHRLQTMEHIQAIGDGLHSQDKKIQKLMEENATTRKKTTQLLAQVALIKTEKDQALVEAKEAKDRLLAAQIQVTSLTNAIKDTNRELGNREDQIRALGHELKELKAERTQKHAGGNDNADPEALKLEVQQLQEKLADAIEARGPYAQNAGDSMQDHTNIKDAFKAFLSTNEPGQKLPAAVTILRAFTIQNWRNRLRQIISDTEATGDWAGARQARAEMAAAIAKTPGLGLPSYMNAEMALSGYYSALIDLKGNKNIRSAEYTLNITDNLLATRKGEALAPHLEEHRQFGSFVRTLVNNWDLRDESKCSCKYKIRPCEAHATGYDCGSFNLIMACEKACGDFPRTDGIRSAARVARGLDRGLTTDFS